MNISANYFANNWLDFFPERRTNEAISLVDNPITSEQVVTRSSDLYNEIIFQEKAPAAFTLDFFGGKSLKINKTFLYLQLGVSNILDNQELITGGFEQYRFDFQDKNVNKFQNRYFYGLGRTYFLNLSFRI